MRRIILNKGKFPLSCHSSVLLIILFSIFSREVSSAEEDGSRRETNNSGSSNTPNCFSLVLESEWPAEEVLKYNHTSASMIFSPQSANRDLLTCLEDQRGQDLNYRITLLRDGTEWISREFGDSGEDVEFLYLVLPGVYSARFDCQGGGCDGNAVTTHPFAVVEQDSCDGGEPIVKVEERGFFSALPAEFVVDFAPGCSSSNLNNVQYLRAKISLYESGTVFTISSFLPFNLAFGITQSEHCSPSEIIRETQRFKGRRVVKGS